MRVPRNPSGDTGRDRGQGRGRAVWAGALAAILTLAACNDETILPGPRTGLRGEPLAPPQSAVRTAGISRAALPPAVAAPDWTERARRSDRQSGHTALAPAPQRLWSADIGTGADRRHRITADPVIAGGLVYTMDARGMVGATTTAGQTAWRVSVAPTGDRGGDASGGGLAVSGGRLYVTTGYGELIALNPRTGGRYWTQDLRSAASAPPSAIGGRVYAATSDATGWAVDGATGKVLWTVRGVERDLGILGAGAPAAGEGLAVFAFDSGEIFAADAASGTPRWRGFVAGQRTGPAMAAYPDISGDPVIANGTVVAASQAGRMTVFGTGDGAVRWAAGTGAMSPPAVAGNSIFVVSDRNELVRLDRASGRTVWSVPLPLYTRTSLRRRTGTFAHYGPVLSGGRLWVASSDRTLRAFDPSTGGLVSSMELPGRVTANPAVANGVLYLVTEDGRLHAYR